MFLPKMLMLHIFLPNDSYYSYSIVIPYRNSGYKKTAILQFLCFQQSGSYLSNINFGKVINTIKHSMFLDASQISIHGSIPKSNTMRICPSHSNWKFLSLRMYTNLSLAEHKRETENLFNINKSIGCIDQAKNNISLLPF